MNTALLDKVESKCLKKDTPHFEIGDIVDVHCRIKEGDKERIGIFSGTVIARKAGVSARPSRSAESSRAKVSKGYSRCTRPISSISRRLEAARPEERNCITSASERVSQPSSSRNTANILWSAK